MREKKDGVVEVICGPVCCGKTEETKRRLRRVRIARLKIKVFKHVDDTRASNNEVFSHDGSRFGFKAVTVRNSGDIKDWMLTCRANVVAIDGAQFFDEGLVEAVDALADRGIRVIVNGLDMNFRGQSFPVMAEIITKADKVDKLPAICVVCGEPATRSQRLVKGKPAPFSGRIITYESPTVTYEARCRHCHEVPKD